MSGVLIVFSSGTSQLWYAAARSRSARAATSGKAGGDISITVGSGTSGAGGLLTVASGQSTVLTGGAVGVSSGEGIATTSGAITIRDCECWRCWRERRTGVQLRRRAQATSGSISIGSGAATSGKAGVISITVGSGNSGAGGLLTVASGQSTVLTGGAVGVSTGEGIATTSGAITIRTANAGTAGVQRRTYVQLRTTSSQA